MNVHEEAAGTVPDELLGDPLSAACLADARRRLRAGAFDGDYVAAIGQTHWGVRAWPMEQVAAFLVVHAELGAGGIASVRIEVGEGPSGDACREENAAKLSQLPFPFSASVDLGQRNSSAGDGWLEWSEPISMRKSVGVGFVGEHGRTYPVCRPYSVRASTGRCVPLEIGDSKPSVTLLHLVSGNRSVARWPYGSPFITLFAGCGQGGFGLRWAEWRGRTAVGNLVPVWLSESFERACLC